MNYPESPRGDVVDDLHGVAVPDPYRWLEDPASDATRRWIAEQNALTQAHLAQIPAREGLKQRLTELWNYERYGVPERKGGRLFYLKNDGLQNQAVLYVRQGDTDRVLLDPNALSADGTVALTAWSISEDGRWLAYGTSDGGSDWRTWRVRSVDSGQDTDDLVQWTKWTEAAWSHDSAGFWYGGYDAPKDPLEQVNHNQRLHYHRLGTPQGADVLVYERPDEPEWGYHAWVTEDGERLMIVVWKGSAERNRLFTRDLTAPDAPVVPLLDANDAEYLPLGKVGDALYVRTTNAAPRGRIVRISLSDPAPAAWAEIVPETEDTLVETVLAGDVIVVAALRDARSVVHRYGLDGTALGEVALPDIGTATGFVADQAHDDCFFAFTAYTTPTTVYRLDGEGALAVWEAPRTPFDPSDYETRQVFYKSPDGTPIPLCITHRRGLAPTGDLPTILYGYGGFNVSVTPGFSVSWLVWIERGGVVAVANLRGGGEYGQQWHEAGTRAQKQNVFDDFHAAAEWLIEQGYTRPDRLAIHGGSNGGLLVGACVQQRPELYGAALPAVGVMDMLRYDQFTIGWAWRDDYGSSTEADMLPVLLAYSPVHNARPAHYPPILVLTGDHDDRVVPAHSYKFTAAMQHAQQGDAPVLIRVETRAGHGMGKPTWLQIEEVADKWAFCVRALRVT